MKSLKTILAGFCLMLTSLVTHAQSSVQNIRGTITDKDSQMPLIGANVSVLKDGELKGTSTDMDGTFRLENVPVGRVNLQITYLGYETITMSQLLLTSGKELILNIEMVESMELMDEVVVTARHDKTRASNEMATVSARSFSVEETSRYAGSFFDPARMALNYAGVNLGGGDDLSNEIIIRGNSPKGLLWKLEGIEIPNPNHFGSTGGSGGAVSMLSSSILTNSDFYTGAFPAEYGNASSGVFDLKMRTGNNEKGEYAFMLGVLGIEAAAEGPIHKASGASYLINYRYSTLSALEALGLSPVDEGVPNYQDLSFKVHVPTNKLGIFSLWGLMGKNRAQFSPPADSTQWLFRGDEFGYDEGQQVGTIGLSHRLLLSNQSYLHTVIAASQDQYTTEEYFLDAPNQYRRILEEKGTFNNNSLRLSSYYNHKLDAQNTIRAGIILTTQDFDFNYDYFPIDGSTPITFFDNQGNSEMIQAYGQWRHKLKPNLTLNTGFHYTRLTLNGKQSLEPRAALKWNLDNKRALSFAAGIHSRPEHLSFYFTENQESELERTSPNRDLEIMKSFHAVIGYDQLLTDQLRLKVETYYQRLYDVPVESDINSVRSILNAADMWDYINAGPANNEGTGYNIGVDVTLERFFSNQFYYLLTGSLFESKYAPQNGVNYSTRYNGNYNVNALVGKEFSIGRKKNTLLSFNAKTLLSGGNRFTPIDVEASREKGFTVRDWSRAYADKSADYFRFDMGVHLKINRKKMSHAIMLDIQNVSNRLNEYIQFYNGNSDAIDTFYQNGLLPVFNYRIEF